MSEKATKGDDGLTCIPVVTGTVYSINSGGSVTDFASHNRGESDNIYVKLSDSKDVEEGYLRIFIVVPKKSYERVCKFSFPGHSPIQEIKAGDISGQESMISGLKYATMIVKLDSGNNYDITYGKAGTLGSWSYPAAVFRIRSYDLSKISGHTHYVYFDEDNIFGSDASHLYNADKL
ncbi:hypothetical protein ACTA71_009306 [Dictyostelium dimigraforme]